MAKRIPVLLVSSRPEVAEAFRRDPASARYILTVRSPQRIDATDAAHNFQVALIDSDSFDEAIELGRTLRSNNSGIEFVPIVPPNQENVGLEGIKHGAFDYHVWPSRPEALWKLLGRCLDRCQPRETETLGPFGTYRLVRKIAAGGMAEVFLAEPLDKTAGGGRLVLKRILPRLAEKPDFVHMFMDEARIGALLLHPNIVRVLDFGRAQDLLYMTMEYVEGANLHQLFHSTGRRIDARIAAYLIEQAAAALHYVHEVKDETGEPLKIVHRDVSPPNILVSTDGIVKVSDFGIATAARRYAETTLGAVKGKVNYMSPDQVRQEKPLDRRVDVFALGTILYELATSMHPFRRASATDTVTAIRSGNCLPPTQANPTVDPALETIILRAIANQRQDRYPTAGELAADLRAWLQGREDVGAPDLKRWVSKVDEPDSRGPTLIVKN